MLRFVAKNMRDNSGPIPLFTKHPRKELLEHMGRKHANKMYVDTTAGDSRHVGWVIGGAWFEVWRVTSLHERDGAN